MYLGRRCRFDYTTRMLADPLPPTLARQVALVTGGARRVGKAIAIELARRGARVAIHANSSLDEAHELGALLEETYGADVAVFQAELTDDGAAEELVHRVARHFACTGEACDEHAGVLQVVEGAGDQRHESQQRRDRPAPEQCQDQAAQADRVRQREEDVDDLEVVVVPPALLAEQVQGPGALVGPVGERSPKM